jgi:hypothetical protein
MKNLLTTFVLTASLLAACNTTAPVEPVTTPTDQPSPTTSMEGSLVTSEQTVNADGTVTIFISWKGEIVATLTKDAPVDGYEVVLFDQTEKNAYIAVNPTGFGGYILYGGARTVYQINLETKAFVEVYANENGGFATDVSPNDSTIATFSSNEVGELILSLYSIEEYKEGPYTDVSTVLDEKFFQAGDAVFSPDSTKVAYAATIAPKGFGADVDTGTDLEKTTVFIMDLDTGKVETFKEIDGTVDITWESGDEPTLR